MVAPYPQVDPRRETVLRSELAAMARTLVPGWRGPQEQGDAGWALMQIAARLSEHVTRRLDETPRRDALAFFSLLDIPPPAARAAEAPVVFTLAAKRTTAVTAPERTQLTASAAGGEELVFETTSAALLTPARLDQVVTVDGRADRIESAPPSFTSLAPPTGAPTTFEAVTFASAESTTLQLTPSLGLEPEDLLRTGGVAYRVKEAGKTGLVELHEPLERALPAGELVTKITRLESFKLRDRQEHLVLVGHKELLKLDGPAIITLYLEPAGLARALARLHVAFELWGTQEGEKQPAWQELVLLSAAGGKLRLAKAWSGSVDEIELGGHKSRFLRLLLRSPIIAGTADPVSPLSTLALGVQSLQPDELPSEGAVGVTAAVHNGSPLPLTGAFLPFGPEPQRFDVFAFAAPEMLSKRGATATVAVTLLDGSVAALAIGAGLQDAEGIAVAIGTNGELRALRFEADGLATDLVGHPMLADSSVSSAVPDAEPTSLRLAAGPNLATITVNTGGLLRHLVVVTDLAGRVWSIALRRLGDGSITRAGSWQLLDDAQPNRPPRNLLLLPLDPPTTNAAAVTLVQRDDGMRISRLREDGAQQGAWRLLHPATGVEPELGPATQVVPVRAAQWPELQPDIVVVDEAGAFFHGAIDELTATVDWASLGVSGSNAVRPAATVLAEGELLIQGADPERRLLTLVDGTAEPNPPALGDLLLASGTRIELAPHPNAAAGPWPIVLAFGSVGDAGEVILFYQRPFAPELFETPLVAPAGANDGKQAKLLVGGLIVTEDAARAIFAGEQETVAQRVVSGRTVSFDPHDALIFEPGNGPVAALAPGFVVLDPEMGATTIKLDQPVISTGAAQIYATAGGTLSPEQSFAFFPDDAFDGELVIDENDDVVLNLDPTDDLTAPGRLIELTLPNQQLPFYARVEHRIDSVATFEPGAGLSIGIALYRPALAEGVVAANDRQTLLEFTAGVSEWPKEIAVLRFGQDIDPPTQTVREASAAGSSPWVLVSKAWSSAPGDGAEALLMSQAATTWRIDDFTVPFNNPNLSYEYWNGQSWSRLDQDFQDSTYNLASSGDISFTVPEDIETTEIAGQEDYWVRVRLVGGDYGRATYHVTSKTNPDKSVTQSITIETSSLSPPEIRRIVTSYELATPAPVERLLVGNNLDLLDQTQAAASPSAEVRLFVGASDLLPRDASGVLAPVALFLGFSQPFDVGQLSFYVDAVEMPVEAELAAQVLGEQGWVDLTVQDDTHGLSRRGFLRLSGVRAPRRERLFGRELFWLRIFPSGAGEWALDLAGLYVNAVPARHAETIEQEVLGNSRGEPNQRYRLARTPILPDSLELRVRERLSDEERTELLQRRGKDAVVTYDERGIKGEWVLWERTDSFIDQSGDARVYMVEASGDVRVVDPGGDVRTVEASGEVRFGDNREGRIPPPGREVIRAVRYQRGGGRIGNVPAFAIEGVRSPLESVEAVANPVAAGGGVDAPTLDELVATAPARLRHGSRALTGADMEDLALAFSPDIRRARCLAPAGQGAPIRLVVLWRTGERCPVPTRVQRDALKRHLAASAWGALGEGSIEVSGPRYVRLAIAVKLRARSAELAPGLEIEADRRLAAFLDPVSGRSDGGGWPFGRPLFESDLARLLHEIPGLAEITELSITPRDASIPPDALIGIDPDDGAVDVQVAVGVVELAEGTP